MIVIIWLRLAFKSEYLILTKHKIKIDGMMKTIPGPFLESAMFLTFELIHFMY